MVHRVRVKVRVRVRVRIRVRVRVKVRVNTSMDPHWVKVFHITHYKRISFCISQHFVLHLFPPCYIIIMYYYYYIIRQDNLFSFLARFTFLSMELFFQTLH